MVVWFIEWEEKSCQGDNPIQINFTNLAEHIKFFVYWLTGHYIFFFDVWHVEWSNPVLNVRGFIKKKKRYGHQNHALSPLHRQGAWSASLTRGRDVTGLGVPCARISPRLGSAAGGGEERTAPVYVSWRMFSALIRKVRTLKSHRAPKRALCLSFGRFHSSLSGLLSRLKASAHAPGGISSLFEWYIPKSVL